MQAIAKTTIFQQIDIRWKSSYLEKILTDTKQLFLTGCAYKRASSPGSWDDRNAKIMVESKWGEVPISIGATMCTTGGE